MFLLIASVTISPYYSGEAHEVKEGRRWVKEGGSAR